MQYRKMFSLFASALLSAVGVTLLLAIQTSVQIEEPWNIVVVSETLSSVRMTFLIVLAHVVLLGLPVYLYFRSKMHEGVIAFGVGGFFVGALPFGLLALFSMALLNSASSGGEATVINGVPTLAGWIEYAQGIGWIGLLGLAGGLIFWLALRRTGQIKRRTNATDAKPVTASFGSIILGSVAILVSAAIISLPNVIRDNSCHNLFRDGRSSIDPLINAEIELSPVDWPKLRKLFVDFGAAHSLAFRGDEQIREGNTLWRDLNLCDEKGVNIDALEQPWLTQINSPLAARGVVFSVYQVKTTSDWRPLTRDLLNQIDTQWPHRTTFRGPEGNVVSRQQALSGSNR